MAQTITLTQSGYKELVTRLTRLEAIVSKFITEPLTEPTAGTKKWWEWAHKQGMHALKKGDYTEITTKKQRDAYFKSL